MKILFVERSFGCLYICQHGDIYLSGRWNIFVSMVKYICHNGEIYFRNILWHALFRLFLRQPLAEEHCKVGRWINRRQLKCLSRQLLTASFLISTLADHLSTLWPPWPSPLFASSPHLMSCPLLPVLLVISLLIFLLILVLSLLLLMVLAWFGRGGVERRL